MHKLPVLLFSIIAVLQPNAAAAQTPPDHAWLETSRVRVRISPTGVHAGPDGGFVLLPADSGAAPIELLRHLAPWVGGVDPGGNLKLAVEERLTSQSDFEPGFRGVAGSAGVWKVTKADVDAHVDDFLDNGVVDNPLPAILTWPAWGNTFSPAQNGFALTDSSLLRLAAGFVDRDFDGVYEPMEGDFPQVQKRGVPALYPTDMIFAPFHTRDVSPSGHPLPALDVNLQVYRHECNLNDWVESAIYFTYTYFNSGVEDLDSAFFGYYLDFNIGAAVDDYLGTVPARGMVYAYNADTTYDAAAGAHPPMAAFFSRDAVISFSNSGDLEFNELSSILPLFAANNAFPPGMTAPGNPAQYYNYLTGRWRDGTPLTGAGNGYQTAGPVTQFVYSGNPGTPAAWNEFSAGNPPQNRVALAAVGPAKLPPLGAQEFTFLLTATAETGPTAQLASILTNSLNQWRVLNHVDPDPLWTLCAPTSTTAPSSMAPVLITPNPAFRDVRFSAPENALFRHIQLFDLSGRLVRNLDNLHEAETEVDVQTLPAGLYVAVWQLHDGRQGRGKVVVGR